MADRHENTRHENTGITRRARADLATLLVGLFALMMSVSAFVGELPVLPGFDPRWLLAAGAALLGVVLLVGSLRGRRNT